MIYVECETEEAITSFLHPKNRTLHVCGKSRVLKRLGKQEHSIGVIDEDSSRPQPPLLRRYVKEEEYEELGIKILSNHKANRLIVLCPRLEE
jgi:hypothetical protein